MLLDMDNSKLLLLNIKVVITIQLYHKLFSNEVNIYSNFDKITFLHTFQNIIETKKI